ncbi:hypothetical protein HF521_015561 [Silurus meridionalis]|uniref:Cyclin-dependent kinases regulatory subunit n=1 Tax=Silurus meridionalis TaxID=175797 RepID=A0A8T0A5D7_SILME|nr:hypothetical protein HF521_015561 [Silurus meridionalis]
MSKSSVDFLWKQIRRNFCIMSHKQIYYSDKYDDEKFEYRHVMLPKDIAKRVPKTHLMSETEWRNLGNLTSFCSAVLCPRLNPSDRKQVEKDLIHTAEG